MCGIIGILSQNPIEEKLFHGMLHLQHRGHDASGVVLFDASTDALVLRKQTGWVSRLFEEGPILPQASWGLGHIRYATSGKGGIAEAQPFVKKQDNHTLALVHNGHLVNYMKLRKNLEQQQIALETYCDSEALLHLLLQHLDIHNFSFSSLCSAVKQVYAHVVGSYSVIGIITGYGVFAFRDPKGIRPLLLGKGEHCITVASESLSLNYMGCKNIEDVAPGELIFIDKNNVLHQKILCCEAHSHCAFEFNYFAKTPTVMEKKEIYSVRFNLGRLLAKKIFSTTMPPIDVVVPIPDTGTPAGIALAQHLHVHFAEGFVRHHHIGRTFILAGQEKRKSASIQKLTPIHSVFQGKSILLVDDSIVRGTVSKRTIAVAREAGAKKVFFASTFPPVLHPCIYGIDFPSKDQLIAPQKSIEQICAELGADLLIYNDPDTLREAIGLDDLCLACLTGNYPTGLPDDTF